MLDDDTVHTAWTKADEANRTLEAARDAGGDASTRVERASKKLADLEHYVDRLRRDVRDGYRELQRIGRSEHDELQSGWLQVLRELDDDGLPLGTDLDTAEEIDARLDEVARIEDVLDTLRLAIGDDAHVRKGGAYSRIRSAL